MSGRGENSGGGRGQNRGGASRGHNTGNNERGGGSHRGGSRGRGGPGNGGGPGKGGGTGHVGGPGRGGPGHGGGPGRGGSSGNSDRGRGQNHGGASRGGHNTDGGKCSGNPTVEKAILEERVRQLERATKDVKSMVKNMSANEGDKSKDHPKKPERDGSKDNTKQHAKHHKDTRGSQSVGNLSGSNKTPHSKNHHHNKGHGNEKRQEDHKHMHGPRPTGHQGQVRGPFPNAPRHPGPSSNRHPQPFPNPPRHPGNSFRQQQPFPNPPRHSGPSFRQQQPGSFYQEKPPPPYDSSMIKSTTTSFGQMSFNEPPPPYDSPSHPGVIVDVKGDNIARALSCFRDQFTDAEKLGLQVKMKPKDVVEVVKKREDVFSTMMDGNKVIIELCPKIQLCTNYLTPTGCNSVGTCRQLHLCLYFIKNECRRGDQCQFGHSWETDQNQKTLTHFLLNNVERTILPGLVKKFVVVGLTPRICYYYNKGTCRKNDMTCNNLHICFSYADNAGNCRKDGCSLLHNIMAPHCKNMLEKFGISTNDSPRDVLLKLTAESKNKGKDTNVSNFANENSTKNSDNDANEGVSKKVEKSVKMEEDSSENDSDCNSEDSHKTSDSVQETKSKKKKKNRKRNKSKENKLVDTENEHLQKTDSKENRQRVTCWSTHFQGDVDVVEICLYSMDGVCTNEERGCRYLHCKTPFHWQFQCDDDDWINLRTDQAKVIEDAFCDVSKNTIKLHSLDPSKLDDAGKRLLSIMGTSSWIANFKTLTIVNESSQLKVYKLRRISTRSAAVSESSKATKWEWYFRDEKDNWIIYGSVDSQGNVTSDDIEKHYLNDSSKPMDFMNLSYKYQLDFNSLKQYNLSTGQENEVRRRPAKRHVYDDSLPSNWDTMSGSGPYSLVNLSENSEEYNDIFGNIKRSLPMSKIINIQRLQNPYLLRAFQNKQEEMSHYYNKADMNIQKLYYGAKPENISSICKENFDWRIHDANSKKAYGNGTYFFNSCATAKQICTKDDNGSSFLFIAEVILGSVTKGNESDSHPPLNTATQRLYDTTLDDPEAPTTFVKYEKQEYYPAYIIEIQ